MVKSDKGKIKNDYFTNVMIVQTVVCVIIIALLFISAGSEGKFASAMKTEYAKLMTGDFSAQDVQEAFKSIIEYTAAFSDNAELVSGTVIEATSEEESESVKVGGGADLEFTSLDTLEGICFDPYSAEFSVAVPLEKYEVTSLFGYRISPISGNAGIHTGIDMAADYGASIYAAAGGTVVDAAYDSSYGYYVKLAHEDNFVTIYAHCSKLCVNAGDVVDKGEKIAQVGSTGDSTGNHLHFEMRKDNIRIDPGYALFSDDT